MARLPQPGGDEGTWGAVLNDYLSQAHKTDGNLKDDVVNAATIQDGTVTETLLASGVTTKLNGAVQKGATYISASDYGWSASASAATNDNAIATAISAAKTLKRPLFLGGGTFHISVPIDARATSTWGGGLELFGVSREFTTIVQDTDSAEILQVGGFNCYFHDIRLQHASDNPTTSTGDGLVFYKSAYCQFKRLQITNNKSGVAIFQGDVNEPGTSSGTGNYMFSNNFEDINVLRYAKSALFLNGVGGHSTGSVWSNLYLHNLSASGTKRTAAGWAIDLYLVEESVFNQVNIEDLADTGGVVLVNAGGWTVFNSLHIERVNLGNYNSQYVRSYGNTGLVINSITVSYGDAATGASSGNSRVFSVAAGGKVDVRGVTFNNMVKTTSARRYTLAEIDDTNAENSVEITYLSLESSVAFNAMSDSTGNAGMKRIGDNFYYARPEPVKVYAATINGLTSAGAGQTTAVPSFGASNIPLGQVTSNDNLDVTTNANAITIPAGLPTRWYTISAHAKFTTGTSANRALLIRINGSTRKETTVLGISVKVDSTLMIKLAAGDIVSLTAYAEAACNVDCQTTYDTSLSVIRVPAS